MVLRSVSPEGGGDMSRPPSEIVFRRSAAAREMHSLGIYGGVARELLKLNRSSWVYILRKTGLKFQYGSSRLKKVREASSNRAAEMASLYTAGVTLQQIGEQ